MLYIAQANAMPQTENIAIQILIYILVGVGGGIVMVWKAFVPWVTSMKEAIELQTKQIVASNVEITKVIISEHAKTREQYVRENEKKRAAMEDFVDEQRETKMAVMKLAMKIDREDVANGFIKNEASR